MISNPHFAKLHLQQLKQNNTASTRLFLTTRNSFDMEAFCAADYQNVTLMQHNIPMKYLSNDRFQFVGSCNGLICVAFQDCCFHDCQIFVVFNPTTRQVRELPLLKVALVGFAFYGFGYDSKVDDYKIVVFLGYADASIEIFNLSGNSWRAFSYQYCGSYFFDGNGVFLNGILHWAICGKGFMDTIVRFDIVEERFLDTIPLPIQIDSDAYLRLAVIDECLCASTYDCYSKSFRAWKMMDYGVQDSWARVYQFSNDDDYAICKFHVKLLYIAKTGRHLFAVAPDSLIVYNPNGAETVLLRDATFAHGGIIYIQSLVSSNIA